jgi:hypothetical protein
MARFMTTRPISPDNPDVEVRDLGGKMNPLEIEVRIDDGTQQGKESRSLLLLVRDYVMMRQSR